MSSPYRFPSLAVCAFSTIILSSCQSTSPSQAALKDVTIGNQGYPPPAECATGEARLVLQLAGRDEITRADVGLTGQIDELIPQQAENDASGYRLDLCVNEANDAISLKRMVQRTPTVSAFNTYHNEFIPDVPATSAAWQATIADGGSSDLEVRFRNVDKPGESVLLKGWSTAAGKTFVTVSRFDWTGVATAVTSPIVTYGSVVEGDPWITTFKKNDRKIKAGTVEIDLRYDVKEGQNNYKTYRVRSIKLEDTNSGLAQPFTTTITGADLDQYLQINYTHHSLSDGFVLTFPHAVYRIGAVLGITYTGQPVIPAVTIQLGCTEISHCGEPI